MTRSGRSRGTRLAFFSVEEEAEAGGAPGAVLGDGEGSGHGIDEGHGDEGVRVCAGRRIWGERGRVGLLWFVDGWSGRACRRRGGVGWPARGRSGGNLLVGWASYRTLGLKCTVVRFLSPFLFCLPFSFLFLLISFCFTFKT